MRDTQVRGLKTRKLRASLTTVCIVFFFFSSRRRHTRCSRDWSSDVCSSDLVRAAGLNLPERTDPGGAHALAPQGSGMAIDVIDGSNFQILLAGGRRQDQEIGRASCRERV